MARCGDARRTVRWEAPGRINLIGEHTDYNDGFALPFALQAGCVASVQDADDGRVTVRSRQLGDEVSVGLPGLAPGVGVPPAAEWARYALGAVWVLRRSGFPVRAVDVDLDSGVPIGAGLSSSAAVVCSVTTALADLWSLDLGDDELLRLTREVENDFVGAPTGGMDQLASLRCTAGHALFCDMRTLETAAVPLPLAAAGVTVLVIDSRAEHRHVDGEYARRRRGCERAARRLGVDALRDVAPTDLDAALTALHDDELGRYTRHVVTENDRVQQTVALLRDGRIDELGALLDASHASMRDDFRITVPPVDLAVEGLVAGGALGARMTGGGFGGCVIGLVPHDAVPAALAAVQSRLAAAGFREPGWFTVEQAAGGAHRVGPDPAL